MNFTKTIASVIFCIFLLALSGTFFPVFADPDEEFSPDEVVVKLRSIRHLRQIAKRYRLSPSPIEQFGTRPIYRMRILDGANPETRAAELQNDLFNRIEFAEPNYLTQAPEARGNSWSIGGTSTQYANQWFRDPLRIQLAHQQTMGAGVKIAVLDTGIDLNHPAFAERLISGYDFVNDDTNPSEEGVFGVNTGFGHGTHVAGLALLVAPQAQIMPIRVLDANGIGNIWVLAEALRFAADPDGNPATADGADVINLSLATRRQTTLLAEIIAEITCGEDDDFGEQNQCSVHGQRGIFVAAGAGNRASNIPEYPAAEGIDGLIAVAASNQMNQLAQFSNFGSWIDVAAPGQQILSTVPGGGYGTWSGTSMSTPLIAGTAALVRAQNPDWTAFQIKERIILSSIMMMGTSSPQIRVDVAGSVGQ
jgi:hypothetical protein